MALNEFGERRGDPQRGPGFDSKFVVAAAQILHEGVAVDHHLRGAIGLKPAHRSQPAFELTMVGLDRIVRVLLDVVPRRRNQLAEHTGVDGRGVGDHRSPRSNPEPAEQSMKLEPPRPGEHLTCGCRKLIRASDMAIRHVP
jgi:hypothetical protein